MLIHKVQLIACFDPLKYLFSRATLTGILAKWVMILSEFDIEYVDRKAIKGQIIENESVFTLTTSTIWKLYFDGSYTNHGAGVGILFITPQGDSIPNSFIINCPCTNNIAEYKALIIGLRTVV